MLRIEADRMQEDYFGSDAKILFEEWQDRGYSEDDDDIKWVKRYLEYAALIRHGIKPEIPEINELPEPFTEEELRVVNKFLWGRKSGRAGWADREISDEIINAVCEPQGQGRVPLTVF